MKIRPFRINLSSHPGRHVAIMHAGLGLLSLLFIALIAWDWQEVKVIREQAQTVEQAIARVREQDRRLQSQAKTEMMDLSDGVLQTLPREVAFANQLIARRAFSWTHFLHDLEDAVPGGIAIHNIKVDVKASSIALGGTALGLKDLTAFIIRLEDHPAFKQAVLGQHRTLKNGHVEFGLTVRYQRKARGA
jgi:type IV pilus assembly protein PilN